MAPRPRPRPRPRTVGEERAGVSRAARWFVAIAHQLLTAAFYADFLFGFPHDDPLYFSRVPWRLPLLLSMYAYSALVALVRSHVDLFLPRVPFAVHQALLYGGSLAVGCSLLGLMGSFALSVAGNDVVAACTGFVVALVAGLIVLWAWLVCEYGGDATMQAPAAATRRRVRKFRPRTSAGQNYKRISS